MDKSSKDKQPASGKPDNLLSFPQRNINAGIFPLGLEKRQGERMEIFRVAVLNPASDDRLMIDCMFACISADTEKLAQMYWLLSGAFGNELGSMIEQAIERARRTEGEGEAEVLQLARMLREKAGRAESLFITK